MSPRRTQHDHRLQPLRRAVERDRYGLMAYVLVARDHCTPLDCAVFRALTDHNQISANMDQRVYEGLIIRYSPSWNAPRRSVAAALSPPSPPMPGKPTNADFPTAASTPPVSIMTPEPGTTPQPRRVHRLRWRAHLRQICAPERRPRRLRTGGGQKAGCAESRARADAAFTGSAAQAPADSTD